MTAGYIKRVVDAYQGEVRGQSLFATLRAHAPDALQAYKMRVLEQLELETGARLREVVDRLGGDSAPAAAEMVAGEAYGQRLAGKPWAEVLAGFRTRLPPFVRAYDALEAEAEPEDQAALTYLARHERAIAGFVEAELAARPDSMAQILALLANPPSFPDEPEGVEGVQISPLTPAIGAEVLNVDLARPLDDMTFRAIHDALMEHQVIFFRDQDFDHQQHLAFGRRFGALAAHPVAPHIEGYPELMRIHTDENSRHHNGADWHTDLSCEAEPPLGSVLRLRTVPEAGGDTLFSSMYAAYDALSPAMRALLDPLVGIHESRQAFNRTYGAAQITGGRDFPSAEHPVIRTHPVTKRKAIYVNSTYTTKIKGMAQPESDALLGFLFEHVASPAFQCRFTWRANSVAFWDNRCVQHLAIWDYFPHLRSGARVTISGDRPFR